MKSFSLNSNLIKVVHSPEYPISEIDSGSSGENIFRNPKIMTFFCFRAEAREIEATWLSGRNIFLLLNQSERKYIFLSFFSVDIAFCTAGSVLRLTNDLQASESSPSPASTC